MKTQAKFCKWGSMLATLFVALSTSSCKEGFIYEGEGDCGTYYNIEFKYDYNMKFADAFANEVTSLSLYVFDQEDTLVETVTVSDAARLAADDFAIALELESGKYELLHGRALEMRSRSTSWQMLLWARRSVKSCRWHSRCPRHDVWRLTCSPCTMVP